MIIFNIPAVIVALIILSINYALALVFPDFMNLESPYFWVTFLAVSGITEFTSLKGRLFWLPLWIIAAFGFIKFSVQDYQIHETYGAALLLLALLSMAFFSIKAINIKQWNRAQEHLAALSRNSIDFSNKQTRSLFKKAFFVPQYLLPNNNLQVMVFGKLYATLYTKWFSNAGRNAHYSKFMSILKDRIPQDLYDKKAAIFHTRLLKLQAGKQALIEEYMVENIIDIMETDVYITEDS